MTGLRILLVEDNVGDARLLRELLSEAARFDHTLSHVDRLARALAALDAGPVDVVLLDLTLPDAVGLDGLRAIHRAFPQVPILVLTGLSDEDLAIEAMKLGAQDYLVKGEADARLLARSIRYAIERSEAQQAARELVRAQSVHAAAIEERARLRSLFMQAPVGICVHRGPDFVFELANPRYLQLVGKTDLVGKTLLEGIPELAGQGFDAHLEGVMRTGQPYFGNEMVCRIDREGDGSLVEVVFDFVYEPMRDAGGAIEGIMVVATDVTEQVMARKRVEQAIRSRDDLLATVSHDLRSPLATISMASELLRHPQASERPLGAIQRATQQMERLIQDLLDMASIESGHLSVALESRGVSELVEAAMESIQPVASAKQIGLEVDVAAALLPVLCDRGRVLQVFANILGNAVKFTPARGRISVQARMLDPRFVSFAISDTGPGIEPAQLPYVFDRFWQAKETARAGTGLGLAICKGIIQQHGGSISVDSQLGVGTTFVFSLPIASSAAAELQRH